MNPSRKFLRLASTFCTGLLALFLANPSAFGGQGAQRILYTVPNSTFIEDPAGDSTVAVNDTSGSITTLQSAINSARGAHPGSIIVITLLRGATYPVSSAGLTLGSDECLVASGAVIKAANSSVTVPLITISSGAKNVSIAGGTLDGNGANLNGILASSADRVNVDKVIVKNCGLDCILLKGSGNTTFDNEMTVTRCDASGSAAHAGISIQNSTQTYVGDNYCHDNSVGIFLSCAWANVANNVCNNNATGINSSGGNDNVVANNTCNNNDTGIRGGASKGMIVGNSLSGNATAGIASAGSANNFLYNSFGADGANAANFTSGGTGDNIIAFKAALSASGQNYFFPPLIDNQHTSTTIVNGKGRTDVTISSTSIDSVQSQYDSARSANPNNVIVLHLNGTFTLGSSPLTLQSDTCVLLNGTIQINSSTTASAAITGGSSAARVSISGGTIDGGNLTGHQGFSMTSANSMICIDKVTMQNLGDNAAHHSGSDAIHFNGGSASSMVTRCTINKSGARGIWSGSTSNHKILYADNYVALTRAGIDCDFHTFGAVCLFNTLVGNTYGLWYEQGSQHNASIGNISTNNVRYNLIAGNLDEAQTTAYNNFICNVAGPGGTAMVNSGTGTNTFTSHNFFFNNVIVSGSVTSDDGGTENYYSQNYRASGSLTTGPSATYFNSPDVDGNLQILDSNSGLAVTVQNASTSDGAAIVTDVADSLGNGSDNDEWKFIPTGAGYYKIINKNSGLALVVQGASTTNGAPIIQSPYSSSTYNDEWLIQSAGNGLYNFVNRLSGLYLDVTGASTNAGTQLDQWPSNGGANQQFSLVEDAPSPALPDFAIAATPASQSVTRGSGTTYTATITATNGFSSAVALSVSGLPTGATGVFNPTSVSGSGSSTLTVTTSSSTPGGTYTVTITGTSGTLSHFDTVSLVVMDFTISATPSTQIVPAGSGANYTVNLGNINAFSGTISLSAGGLPTGAGASFNPASLTAPGSSTMTVTTSASTPAANSTLTITGMSGSLAHSTTATLSVTDFSLSVNPASQTITAGSNTTYALTVSALNGFSGAVNFTVSGLPTGASGSFNPTSINGSGSSTLTVTTSGSTPAGTNTLTITGTSGGLSHSTTVTLIVNAAGGALPAGWSHQDIGPVGLAGNATFNNNTFTVTGSGSDIWVAADQFHFAFQSVTNDLTITARVATESGTASFAKAAVMIRESTASNAVEVSVLLTPTNGVSMEVRPSTGSNTVNVTGWINGPVPPSWVRLVRSGNTFTSFRSSDGVNWTLMATTNVTMAAAAKAGLAVTSHDNTQLNAATFDNVNLVKIAFTDRDIGPVGLAGSASFSGGVYTVKGSGADIYNTIDQFNYDSQSDSGDATITARVVSISGTNAWAKTGVMIRETTATNSVHVGLYVTPGNGVSMQLRPVTGGGSVDLARQTGLHAPYWVRLVRSGNTFTGFSSADGVSWAQVGSTNVTMGASENIGLAVTSHDNTKLNTATFDNVSAQ